MPQDLTDHLQAAAAHVAQTLVVRELEKLARGGAITVTVRAEPAPAPQKLLAYSQVDAEKSPRSRSPADISPGSTASGRCTRRRSG